MKSRNPKHQISNKFEIRNSKFETRFGILNFGIIWNLWFGIWNLLSLLLLPTIVLAQVQKDCAKDPTSDLCHPYTTVQGGLLQILGQGLQVVLGMIGVVAFIMIIAGAARWMTAGGNAENVDSGKGMIAWAFLGLVLAAAAFVITDFIFGGLRGALFGG